jgi:hypothetical protein
MRLIRSFQRVLSDKEFMIRRFLLAACSLACLQLVDSEALAQQAIAADVSIYGGTSGGVIAAVQAARMGKRAVVVEPGRRVNRQRQPPAWRSTRIPDSKRRLLAASDAVARR